MSSTLTDLPQKLAPDRYLTCENCGITFVWTGWEQEQGDEPARCPGCRHLQALTRRQRGTVKWYDRRKGYGFVTAAGGDEYFVHRQALGRLRTLRRGQVVAFRLGMGQGGPQVVELERLPAAGKEKKAQSGEAGQS